MSIPRLRDQKSPIVLQHLKNPFNQRKRSGQFGLRSSNDPIHTQEPSPVHSPKEKERQVVKPVPIPIPIPKTIEVTTPMIIKESNVDDESMDAMNEHLNDMPLDAMNGPKEP